MKTSPADKWKQLKDVIKVQVQQSGGKKFINPRDSRHYQAALELVGKKELNFDGCYFSIPV